MPDIYKETKRGWNVNLEHPLYGYKASIYPRSKAARHDSAIVDHVSYAISRPKPDLVVKVGFNESCHYLWSFSFVRIVGLVSHRSTHLVDNTREEHHGKSRSRQATGPSQAGTDY